MFHKIQEIYTSILAALGWKLFIFILLFKVIIVSLFSSGYQDQLFSPFVDWFLMHGESPWAAVSRGDLTAEFPYPPLMLYILSFFYYPIYFFKIESVFMQNFIHGIPLLLCDILVLFSLVKLGGVSNKKFIISYFLSPILLFATFIHHQLDVIPISFFLASLCLISKRYIYYSALLFSFALAMKMNVIAILPLIILYLYKIRMGKKIFIYLLICILFYLVISFPFILQSEYRSMVVFNSKQKMLFDNSFSLGGGRIFISLFACICVYAAFLYFEKVNRDLLLSFSTLLFTCLIFFVTPSPGWFLWNVPLIIMIFFKSGRVRESSWLLGMLNLSYFFYFVFAYKFEFYPVAFLGEKLHFTIETSFFWRDLFYTFLEVFLFLSAIYVYFFSLKSNRIYKNRSPFLIGSGGDSSTGKTTLQRLSSKLFQDDLLKIEGDGDHKWERGDARWDEYTHLNPKANWLHRQAEDLYALKNRKGIKRVDYDHKFGKFTKFYELQPKKFTLISSLHPFYLPASRSCLDLKIYMDPDEQLRKHWKIKRDVEKRGYTIAKVLEQMESRMADSSKYIHPQKNFADVVIAFFLKEPIKELGLDNELDLGLRVTLEASVHLDLLISSLDIPYIWDYTNDLKSQVIELQAAPVTIDYEKLSSEMVDNVEELALDAEFEEGYNGFIQLIILLSVSEKMKRNI